MEKLTQEHLKKVLHYNPDTGIFTWKAREGCGRRAGAIAGGRCNGYVVIGINYKHYTAHRLAFLYMCGSFPNRHVDHIDHNRSNNKFNNLRAVTQAQNNRNATAQKNNSSGVTGVYWAKKKRRWLAKIGYNNKVIHLGAFKDKRLAIEARKAGEKKYGYHENHGAGSIT